MGSFFLLPIIVVCMSSTQKLLCAATDRLAVGESISVNQTLVSDGKIFALGFFTPGNSTANRYAGIWYNRIPGRTVVWVANREKPLRDPAGVLTVTGDGNIAVLDGLGVVVWSTNLSAVARSSASAVLLDTGNLVLRHGEDGDVWQSFDHPTDTMLPHMKLRSNFNSSAGPRLTSWRDATDPSPGEFVFGVDPKFSLQLHIMKGSEIYWRGRVWSGMPLTSGLVVAGNLSSLYLETVGSDGQEFYWTFTMGDNSILARYFLDGTGRCRFFYWDDRSQNWTTGYSVPTRPCDFYNKCGPSGSCDATGNSSVCRCLEGFEPRNPREWEEGNYTGGCVRRLPLQCDGGEGFVKLGGMKLPDRFTFRWNMSATQCEAECSASCGCEAYAHADFSSLNRTGSMCLVWLGELIDLGQDSPPLSANLYVRLRTSDLNNNTQMGRSSNNNGKRLIKVILPIVSVGMLLVGICCFFIIKRLEGVRTRKLLGDLDFSDPLGSQKDISDVPLLDFKSVKAVTGNFSSANRLGEGGFGPVYKGKLLNGHEIAVKRLSKASKQGHQEFANEVNLIARLQHKNLVRLLGWCTHKDEKILIYEYMHNKSLDKHIFGPTSSSPKLNWENRFGIIKGIANGLLYLHQHSRMRVIHRDLKTSNILLDSEMNPKISDFGLARIFGMNQTEANTAHVVGTYGYMSPEYALQGVFSDKSDVFSFGVIILEIVTGKRSTGFFAYGNYLNLLEYTWQMWVEGCGLELRDPSMGESFQATEVLKCIHLGLLCVQEDAADRPTMSSIISMLSNENCTLPVSKKPAFAIARNPNPALPVSSGGASTSINELTRSSVEGR